MKFYLNQHGLRMLDGDGAGFVLLDNGDWSPYEGYATWPTDRARIETQFTGLLDEPA